MQCWGRTSAAAPWMSPAHESEKPVWRAVPDLHEKHEGIYSFQMLVQWIRFCRMYIQPRMCSWQNCRNHVNMDQTLEGVCCSSYLWPALCRVHALCRASSPAAWGGSVFGQGPGRWSLPTPERWAPAAWQSSDKAERRRATHGRRDTGCLWGREGTDIKSLIPSITNRMLS